MDWYADHHEQALVMDVFIDDDVTIIDYDGFIDDKTCITGIMFGNDECFDLSGFYQYLITEYGFYKCYYDIPDDIQDLGHIDYRYPCIIECCDEYYLDDTLRGIKTSQGKSIYSRKQ